MRYNKYRVAKKADRTNRDGIVFASKGEMKRYEQLKMQVLAKEIRNLRRQVKYPLVINGIEIGHYTADFVYEERDLVPCVFELPPHTQMSAAMADRIINPPLIDRGWREVIEDFKGVMTTDAKFRIRVFEVIHNKKVRITKGR